MFPAGYTQSLGLVGIPAPYDACTGRRGRSGKAEAVRPIPRDVTAPEAGTTAAETGVGADGVPRDVPRVAPAWDRLLDELLARMCRVLDADAAQILLVEGEELRIVAAHGLTREGLADLRLPLGDGFEATIVATGAPAAVADLREVAGFGTGWYDAGVRALVGVPLVVDDRRIGAAVVGSREQRSFGDADIQLLTDAAERAVWAVRHGLLLAAERDARDTVAERLTRLRVIAQELLTHLTVESVVDTVVNRGLSLLGAMGGAVWELTDDETLHLRGTVGYPADIVERWQALPLSAEGPSPEAARTGSRVVLRSVGERDDRYPALKGRGSVGDAFVAAPLVVEGRTIGVLGLGFERAVELDEDGLAFIDAATAQCAAAMHRALVVEARERSLAAAQESARRLAALQGLTARLADARDEATTLDVIVEDLVGAIGAEQCAVSLLDPDAQVMHTVRFHGMSPEVQAEFRTFPVEPGMPAGDALLRHQPVLLRTPEERDSDYPALEGRPPAVNAWACLPLSVGDRDLGVLSLGLHPSTPFGPADLEFFAALADQCAHALERARLLESEAANRDRLELLAEAGRIFTAPLDMRLTSRQFSQLVVGRIADAVSVHLREPDGSYSLAASEHRDPEQAELQRLLALRLPDVIVDFYDDVLSRGETVVFSGLTPEEALAPIEDEVLRAGLAKRPPETSVVLPLLAGGRALGVLVATTVAGGRPPLGSRQRAQLEELAGRLALAIDSARLLRQQIEIAHTLQRSLLPASLPRVPGAEVAVRYLPGAEGVDVGGDFYDVIPLPSGRIGLVVGDVMGRGVRAAAVMGQLRAAVRSYSLEGHPPAALLTRLDRLVGTLEEGLLVTALYAEWDPKAGTVLCACAGHLPPLLRLPGGEPAYVELDPGVPLGVGLQSYREVELALPPGSLLVAYTDGLVEGRDLPVEVGMQRLAAAVAGAYRAIDVCDAALDELRPAATARRVDDDTALLALVTHDPDEAPPVHPDEGSAVVMDLPADYGSPARARTLVGETLDRWNLRQLADPGMLLTSELVTNAVRHAGTGMRLTISRIGADRVRVAVTDHAPGVSVRVRDANDDAEGGRGLFLVEHLSAGWGSAVDDTGKTIWFELQA